ncbi:MAG: hypothetical protein LQ346_007015 [Caloplaca aetnensis]|nr:MAG: hypothetical protein LQ346_007015 [Caloplaca aetnensis]
MSSLHLCLRPPLRLLSSRTAAATASYCRFYAVARVLEKTEAFANHKTGNAAESMRTRTETLLSSGLELYPRFPQDKQVRSMSCRGFLEIYESLAPGETEEEVEMSLQGSSGLAFIDIVQDGQLVQGVCVYGRIEQSGASKVQFRDLLRQIRRGDNYSAVRVIPPKDTRLTSTGIKGKPHRTERGQLSLMATQLPSMQSPCLHEFPTELQNQEARVRNRHLDLQVNPRAAHTLRLRSKIVTIIRSFLERRGYTEMQTPILANSAGGAIARAFETSAFEFPERHIRLRTAPELWLKRLVLGGFEKIFELGIDKTHNPEFTTCEFYAVYLSLQGLIDRTERLLSKLSQVTNDLICGPLDSLPVCEIDFAAPFRRLDFFQEIESAMKLELPDLTRPDAEAELITIYEQLNIRLPNAPTLPRLLDRLSAEFLEPLCQNPTWIVNHPECLAPLSKSYIDPRTQRRVSARAELFIKGKEVVNTYEEENSPFEQRRKFQDQVKYRADDSETDIDENYLQALEWGLPPTGGWGCGVDRLVMLLSGTDRINDVLPFGNLRNVVSRSVTEGKNLSIL